MATPREIRNRIKSVQSTRKITRTMELVSTAKSKRAIDRVIAAQPFSMKIEELLGSLAEGDSHLQDPLLRKVDKPNKAVIMIVSSNRGLCGGFNANTIRLALERRRQLLEMGSEVEIIGIGKKVGSYLKFLKIGIAKQNNEIGEKPSFEEAQVFADDFMDRFSEGKIDQVEIVYSRFYSASKQRPFIKQILPLKIENEDSDQAAKKTNVVTFEPDPKTIIKSLLPRAIRVAVYRTLIESEAGEHIARRIAMKNATSAAGDMIKSMTSKYNRVRQAKITQEIAEIVSGAEAIS